MVREGAAVRFWRKSFDSPNFCLPHVPKIWVGFRAAETRDPDDKEAAIWVPASSQTLNPKPLNP